ncbi:MAG: hypothetical protein JRM85_09325 [Nitrososphaerota archaeon]|nr:hypothetical protein [Nitrososphaerota archaeon]
MPTAKIVRVGIPSAEGLVWPLDNHIGALELWVDRGEVVNATDSGFLEEGDTSETVGEAAVRMRAKRRSE